MGLPKDILALHSCVDEWSILSTYRGSIAHGTFVPNSDPLSIDDKDVMTICVPPIDYYYGIKEFGSRGTKEIVKDEWDIVSYELKKMLRLLAKGNPNVLSVLWLEPKYYLKKTSGGNILINKRDIFSTKAVYRSFTGYAYGQLHKMEHFACKGYMGEKRKKLVTKFGYDTKNASHLIRLLRMGIEFLIDGKLYVERHDATQLLDIKRGKWTLKEVKKEAERLFASAEQAYIKSDLPPNIDPEEVNALALEILPLAQNELHGYLGFENKT